MNRLVVLFAAAALVQGSDAKAQAGARETVAVDAIFSRFATRTTPGCAVAVARDGRTLIERGYGMADLEHDVAITPSSVFEAGSASKQFAAAAIILLVRDGKLKLSDDIRTVLPEMPDYGTPVTVGQLINHTSGLRDWGAVSGIGGWPRNSRVFSNEDVLALAMQQRTLNYAPGTHYTYSNTNFNLAAIIVARIAGQSFAAFTQERIFKPLVMRDTRWRDDHARIVPGRALAYARKGNGYVIDQPIEDAHGNGGLLTTVADLLRWNQALDADTLGPGFTAAMERAGTLKSGANIDYASGLFLAMRDGRREVSHAGATGGYRAWLARYPAERLSVAMLCAASDVDPVDLGRRVADSFLPPAPARRDASTGRLPANGLYFSRVTGLPVRIVSDRGRITANGVPLSASGKGRWVRGDFTYSFSGQSLVVETMGEMLAHDRAEPARSVDTAPLAGRYCGVDNDFCLVVSRAAGGTLQYIATSRPGMTPLRLSPLTADRFAVENGDALRFVPGIDGVPQAISYATSRAYGILFRRIRDKSPGARE